MAPDLVLRDIEALDGHAHLARGDEGRPRPACRPARRRCRCRAPRWRRRCHRARARRAAPRPDAAAMTARPVGTPPVNDTMSTPGWDTSISPSSGPGPLTAFTTPGGRASAIAAATASTAPGQVGGAFTTTVLPASRAGSTLLPSTETGQLKGSNAATTPKGSCTTLVRAPTAGHRPGGQRPRPRAGRRRPPSPRRCPSRTAPPTAPCRARGSGRWPDPVPRRRPRPRTAALATSSARSS